MVVISKTFSIPQFYDSHAIAPLKDLVFLDIETTGLTPAFYLSDWCSLSSADGVAYQTVVF